MLVSFWLDCGARFLRQNFMLVIFCYPDTFSCFFAFTNVKPLLPYIDARWNFYAHVCYWCWLFTVMHQYSVITVLIQLQISLSRISFDLHLYSWSLSFYALLSVASSPAGYRNWTNGLWSTNIVLPFALMQWPNTSVQVAWGRIICQLAYFCSLICRLFIYSLFHFCLLPVLLFILF